MQEKNIIRHTFIYKQAVLDFFLKKSNKSLVVSNLMRTFAPAIQMVPVVQLVRASDCGSECRRFESVRAPLKEVL